MSRYPHLYTHRAPALQHVKHILSQVLIQSAISTRENNQVETARTTSLEKPSSEKQCPRLGRDGNISPLCFSLILPRLSLANAFSCERQILFDRSRWWLYESQRFIRYTFPLIPHYKFFSKSHTLNHQPPIPLPTRFRMWNVSPAPHTPIHLMFYNTFDLVHNHQLSLHVLKADDIMLDIMCTCPLGSLVFLYYGHSSPRRTSSRSSRFISLFFTTGIDVCH